MTRRTAAQRRRARNLRIAAWVILLAIAAYAVSRFLADYHMGPGHDRLSASCCLACAGSSSAGATTSPRRWTASGTTNDGPVSKERAARRAQREADQAVARAKREKRPARHAPSRGATRVCGRPGAWPRRMGRGRKASSFGRRTRGQRIVIAAAALVLVCAAVFASSWGMRLFVLGFTVLLFPVAWRLASGRR